jgi:hypothetical protein
VKAEAIAERLVDHALALQREVSLLSGLFKQTSFLGDGSNLPHAHYGYLMATLGQLDTLSVCDKGGPRREQRKRMVAFLEITFSLETLIRIALPFRCCGIL